MGLAAGQVETMLFHDLQQPIVPDVPEGLVGLVFDHRAGKGVRAGKGGKKGGGGKRQEKVSGGKRCQGREKVSGGKRCQEPFHLEFKNGS